MASVEKRVSSGKICNDQFIVDLLLNDEYATERILIYGLAARSASEQVKEC